MARRNCEYECEYPTCAGCRYERIEQDDPWNDPDYPEYDPAEDYSPQSYQD